MNRAFFAVVVFGALTLPIGLFLTFGPSANEERDGLSASRAMTDWTRKLGPLFAIGGALALVIGGSGWVLTS